MEFSGKFIFQLQAMLAGGQVCRIFALARLNFLVWGMETSSQWQENTTCCSLAMGTQCCPLYVYFEFSQCSGIAFLSPYTQDSYLNCFLEWDG